MPSQPEFDRVTRWRLEVGARLRESRRQSGLSQEELAQRAGVDRKLVYRTELGQTPPRLDALALLAEVLGADLGRMIGPGLPAR